MKKSWLEKLVWQRGGGKRNFPLTLQHKINSDRYDSVSHFLTNAVESEQILGKLSILQSPVI